VRSMRDFYNTPVLMVPIRVIFPEKAHS